ncbi:hypothetical protein M8J76_000825 [Diaphorina citri]|nr:hypothetical protein M8J75_005542 [Diaphorina citri]KAI5736188.1 hypothetical protein M8J76_000825 [Diaphorina citri]
MTDSDTEMGFDPATLLQMDMEDAGSECSAGVNISGDVDIGNESDSATSDHQTPTKNDKEVKLKSFEDEKQYITLMELANGVQREEMECRNTHFNLIKSNWRQIIARSYSHCTMCDEHIPIIVNKHHLFVGHPILKTLVCKDCFKFYGDGNFDRGDDGVDLYCRWCAEGGTLFCCSNCPNVFCKKCVRQNLGIAEMKKVNDASSWSCYVCEPKQLWGYRGMFATISQLLTDFRTGNVLIPDSEKDTDLAGCCTFSQDKKQLVKSNKLLNQYCPGVVIPQVKIKMGPPPRVKSPLVVIPNYSNQSRVEEEEPGSQVSDFFANGHFLEAALTQSQSPPLIPTPTIAPTPQPRIPMAPGTYILVRQPSPRTQLIRPKNLSMLQAAPYKRAPYSPRQSIPPGPRRHTPNILRSQQRMPSLQYNKPRAQTPGPRSNVSYVVRAPSLPAPAPHKPNAIPSPVVQSGAGKEIPTADWFNNVLDQALLSADFYKDELAESVNLAKLHKMKGLPYVSPGSVAATPALVPLATPARVIPASPVTTTPYSAMNGNNKTATNSDVVDLTGHALFKQNHAITISPIPTNKLLASPSSRLSLPSTRIPLTPTPTNRLSIPAQSIPGQRISPGSRRRRRKKLGSDDSEDDEDYLPNANPSVMKKRRRTQAQTNGQTPKLMVTNVRSLNKETTSDTSSTLKTASSSSLDTYMNQVSEDVMARVMQLNSDTDSEVEEVDPEPSRDPLEDEDKDDWITKNPTTYEKYCLQYNLVKDWYIAVKNIDPVSEKT